MRVVTVVGARPQFVKAAAFAEAVRSDPDRATSPIDHRLVHTGQHYDDEMSGVFFRELGLDAPDIDLQVGSGSHGEQTGEMLKRLEPVMTELAPDVLVVFGDTNSTLAAALVAAKLGIPIGHVEAGLRSYRRSMPEEINRVVTDRLSDLLFCPSAESAENCRREGIVDGVVVVGDIMRDALNQQLARIDAAPEEPSAPGPFALATIHRAENTDDAARLASIVAALGDVAAGGLPVRLPLHPRTRALVDVEALEQRGVAVLEPQSYGAMVALAARSQVIVTDSGGVQKEALWLGIPCVTVRDETEWVETVECGWNRLVGADHDAIVAAAFDHRPTGHPPSLYGDGDAAPRIVAALHQAFG